MSLPIILSTSFLHLSSLSPPSPPPHHPFLCLHSVVCGRCFSPSLLPVKGKQNYFFSSSFFSFFFYLQLATFIDHGLKKDNDKLPNCFSADASGTTPAESTTDSTEDHTEDHLETNTTYHAEDHTAHHPEDHTADNTADNTATKEEAEVVQNKPSGSSCRLCGRPILPANLVLHEAHCGRKDRQAPPPPSSAVGAAGGVKKEKKEKKKKPPSQVGTE